MKIVVDNASKQIKGTVILKNVCLTLSGGKIYGFQGPNGSGKTMLMRLVSGLIRPTSGEIYINGEKLGKDIDFPRSMGLLIENPAFLPNHTGLKNLELLAQIKNNFSSEDVRQAIEAVGLDPDDKRSFRKYSLGMKQRLGIASAIMEKQEIIILDEPFNALDEQGVEQICQVIKDERERGALIIMACHDAQILEAMADEIYSIYEGKVKKKNTDELPERNI